MVRFEKLTNQTQYIYKKDKVRIEKELEKPVGSRRSLIILDDWLNEDEEEDSDD